MPVRPVILTAGLRELQRDFKAMIPEANVEIRQTIKGSLEPMVKIAQAQANKRRQTGELADTWRAVARGASGALINRLPQAAPLEFGGTIAPKGTPISLAPKMNMVYGPGGAVQKGKAITEQLLETGFERIVHRHGFSGR